MAAPDDGELLARWRAGDREAGSELFERYFTALFMFFRSKVADVADDLTQQTFMRCVQAQGELRGGAEVRAYLFAIARNLLIDHLRRRARTPDAVDLELTSLADIDPSPSSAFVLREQHQLLVQALRRLPLDLQILLELAYVQRLRGPELAVALDIPLGTVRSRLRRAIVQLRTLLSQLAASPRALHATTMDLQRWAVAVREANVDVARSRP